MKLKQAVMKTEQLPEQPKPGSKGDKSRIGDWIRLLKKGDSLGITYAVNKVPRLEIQNWIDKLSRYKYKKHPGTEVAISKLKWRRGY
jgi:lysophospholipid acyltransferase (LPLAT)-like uncharacterized protein